MPERKDRLENLTVGVLAIEPPSGGGVYQYTRSVVRATESLPVDETVFYADDSWTECDLYDSEKWRPLSLVGRAARFGLRTMFRQLGGGFELLGDTRRWLAPRIRSLDPDLIVLPKPIAIGYETGFDNLMAIHDVQHRLNPQFPEVGNEEVVERRSYIYQKGSQYANGILTDSQAGREDVLNYYDVPDDRVFVLPFVPPDYLNDPENELDHSLISDLPDRYLFYPAQFWEHKNHTTLLEAVARLRDEEGIEVPCVFVGSEKNAYEDVLDTIEANNLDHLIHELGFVSDQKMYTLYSEAVSLVMPTYLGPTNIPPIEAFKMGCPVITSDVHGLPEQVGDAGLLIDPESPAELADAIESVWTDESFRRELSERGKQRVAQHTQTDFTEMLGEHILEATDASR